MENAIEKKKKACQDYKASAKDKSMRDIKKKQYKLQNHQTKVLMKMKREKAENERNESYNEQLQRKHVAFLTRS